MQINSLSEKLDRLLANQLRPQYRNSNFYQMKRPSCTKCKQEGKEDSCNHCFGCSQRKSETHGK